MLTFDYELFGDGTGNVFTHMIEPTNKILSLCNKYNIKATLFFEILEFIRLREEWNKGNTMGYSKDPIKAIEQQIHDAVINGHDIQLHIHPQWYNSYFKNGRWELDLKNWRLGDFYISSEYGVKDLIRDCKQELESLVQAVKPNYQCVAIRAGGFNVMPSEQVYEAMVENNLRVDSSIFPGGYETGPFSIYDYRDVSYEKGYWWSDENDMRKINKINEMILEIPIFALPIGRWQRFLSASKLKSLVFNRGIAISTISKSKIKNKGFFEKIKYIFSSESTPWEVCIFTKKMNKKYLRYIKRNLLETRKTFVLIGHPKNLIEIKNFEHFLKIIHSFEYDIIFKTIYDKYFDIISCNKSECS